MELTLDYEEEIRKLRYHVRLLAAGADLSAHPDTVFIIANEWGADDWDDATDIFNRYEEQIEGGGSVGGLERDLKVRFGCTYQTVKQLVLAMWDAGMCPLACFEYAKANETLEMKRILREAPEKLGKGG